MLKKQTLLLDLMFSADSILTVVGMAGHLPIVVIAAVVAVMIMVFSVLISRMHCSSLLNLY